MYDYLQATWADHSEMQSCPWRPGLNHREEQMPPAQTPCQMQDEEYVLLCMAVVIAGKKAISSRM